MDAVKASELESTLEFSLVVDIDNNHCWSRINVLTDALRNHAEYLQKSMIQNIQEGDTDYAAVNFAEYNECNEMLYAIQQELIGLAMNNFHAPKSTSVNINNETTLKERQEARDAFARHFKISIQ